MIVDISVSRVDVAKKITPKLTVVPGDVVCLAYPADHESASNVVTIFGSMYKIPNPLEKQSSQTNDGICRTVFDVVNPGHVKITVWGNGPVLPGRPQPKAIIDLKVLARK